MGRLKYVIMQLSKEELLDIITALESWGEELEENPLIEGTEDANRIWQLHKKLQGLWIKGDAPPEVIKKAKKMGLID